MTLITVLYNDATLLGDFLFHYNTLGVDRFIIGIYASHPVSASAQCLLARYPCELMPISGPYDGRRDTAFREQMSRRAVRPDEWWVVADLDEFHEYPDQLLNLPRYLDKCGSIALQSSLLDRICWDGHVPASRDVTIDLWTQFPAAAFITRDLMRAQSTKVMLARGHVKLASGHHNLVGPAASHCYMGGAVHHFKWFGDIEAKIRERRHSILQRRQPQFAKCDRFLSFWRRFRRLPIQGEYGFHSPIRPLSWPSAQPELTVTPRFIDGTNAAQVTARGGGGQSVSPKRFLGRSAVRKRQPRPRIWAVVTIYDTGEIVPHFLQHYAKLGVDRILVATNVELENARELEQQYPVTLKRVRYDGFTNRDKDFGEQCMLDEAGAEGRDWVLHLDLDEFHQYPCALENLVELMNAFGIDAIAGHLLDRVSQDGILAVLAATPSIALQYPLGGRLTFNLVHGRTQKVMIARRSIPLVEGRHARLDGKPCNIYPIGIPEEYQVHHFRWVNGLIQRLEERFQWVLKDGNPHRYARRNLQFCEEYRAKGRIELRKTSLKIKTANPFSYPAHSESLARMAYVAISSWDVDDADSAALSRIARNLRPKRVLEFGGGRSTWLWAHLGCEVDSIQVSEKCGFPILPRDELLPNVRRWQASWPFQGDLPFGRYDLTFVDGPPGHLYKKCNRLDAVQFGLRHSDVVLLHDAKRDGERETLDFIASCGHQVDMRGTPRGIAIILAKRNVGLPPELDPVCEIIARSAGEVKSHT